MVHFTPKDITCAQCKTVFRVTQKRHDDRKFCGSACYHAFEKANGKAERVTPIVFHCKKCGNEFKRNPGELTAYRKAHGKDPRYCSRKCGWEGKRKMSGVPCKVCGKIIPAVWDGSRTANRRVTLCSAECRSANKVAETERRRPSDERTIQRKTTKQGYIRLRFPNQNGKKGREVLEHRYVMEKLIGRELLPEETVHHKNGDRSFNDESNIELFSSRHGPGQRVIDKIAFAIEMIQLYPDFARKAGFELRAITEDHQAALSLSI